MISKFLILLKSDGLSSLSKNTLQFLDTFDMVAMSSSLMKVRMCLARCLVYGLTCNLEMMSNC